MRDRTEVDLEHTLFNERFSPSDETVLEARFYQIIYIFVDA